MYCILPAVYSAVSLRRTGLQRKEVHYWVQSSTGLLTYCLSGLLLLRVQKNRYCQSFNCVVSDITISDFRRHFQHFRHPLQHFQHHLWHFRHPQKGFQKSPTFPTSPKRTSDISDKLPTRARLIYCRSWTKSRTSSDILKQKNHLHSGDNNNSMGRESLLVYFITHRLKMRELNHASKLILCIIYVLNLNMTD